jgi:hypothetical protein
MRMHAPQEIVVALLLRGLLEADNVDALRVHRADHMPAGPVLARSVDPLKDDQQAVTAIRV